MKRNAAAGRQLLLAGSFAAGAALFAQSVHSLGRAQIVAGLVRVGWGFVAILALAGVREAVRTLAWMRTVEGPVALGFSHAFRARLAGEALNALLPMGMIVGEPTKASQVESVIPFGTAFSALAVEFAFYCLSLVLLFTAAASAFGAAAKVLAPSTATALTLVAFSVFAGAAMQVRRRSYRDRPIESAAASAIAPAWQRIKEAVLGFGSRHPEHVRPIVACEIAFHVLAIAEVYVTLALVSPVHPTIASAIVLESVSRAVTMGFKMLPMRIGVDEIGSSIFAARVDLDAATGLTLALVRKLRLLFWSGVGLCFLLGKAPAASPAMARQ